MPQFQAGVREKAFEQGESRDERLVCKITGRTCLGAAAAVGALVPPAGLAPTISISRNSVCCLVYFVMSCFF